MKTQYYTGTSIDGYIADRDNSLDWLLESDRGSEGRAAFGAFFAGVGAMCMGATTYEWVLAHDRLLENPQKWHDFYSDRPTWVFTHRDLPAVPGANLTFVSGDVEPVHDTMVAAAAGRNVWLIGGGELVGAFVDRGRLDEIILQVAPVFLGGGAPLLPRRLLSSDVSLVGIERMGQFANLTYAVRRPPG